MWKVGTLMRCLWEYKTVQMIWKTVKQFLKKLKIELPYDPEISLLGICPKELKVVICTVMFTKVLVTKPQGRSNPSIQQ